MEKMIAEVLKPRFSLFYEQKNITKAVEPYYEQITFHDAEHGEADDISIDFEDTQKNWRNDWHPNKGDKLTLSIGYEGYKLLPCGSFAIDEMEIKPHKMSIKAMSTSINKPLRQKNTYNYQQTTLKKIVESFAIKHGYKLIGNVAPIKIQNIVQKELTDLAFLRSLAERYGYNFKIDSENLVFYELEELESRSAAIVLTENDIIDYSFRDKTDRTYKSCTVSYFNPKTGKTVRASATSKNKTKGDVLKLNVRCSSKEEALRVANSALRRSARTIEGAIDIPGNSKICSGVIIEIKGIGKAIEGKYIVISSTHSISKQGGYTTSAEVRKIA